MQKSERDMQQRFTFRGLWLLTLMLLATWSFAQNKINGTVTSAEGPVIGANVLVKGTANGTVTDLDGNFTLDVDLSDELLVISYLGLESQEVEISNEPIMVFLAESSRELDEVIVVAYQTMRKEDKTGAVTALDNEDLNIGLATDPLQSLQGKAAGVTITKNGGDPNAGFKVNIRGAAGFGSGTQPLFVVDGVPGVDLTMIAPQDIESYTILKDASSCAIYGTRGANGVVLVTTRKGVENTNRIGLRSFYSFDQVARRMDLLSANDVRDYVETYNIDFTDGGHNTDWQDEIYRPASSHSENLSFSGGDDNTSYYTSLTYADFQGVIKDSRKERFHGKIDVIQKLYDDKLRIHGTLAGLVEFNDYIAYSGWGREDVLYQTFRRSPTDPVRNEDGSFFESDRLFESTNPVALIDQIDDTRKARRFFANAKVDYEIYDGLELGANFGWVNNDNQGYKFVPSFQKSTDTKGSGNRRYNTFSSKILETTAKYKWTMASYHNVDVLAGYGWQEDENNGFAINVEEPISDFLGANNLQSFNRINAGDATSYRGLSRLISFFGRAQYNYDSKYYLTATVRREGSSKFGVNNQWGTFPSASVAWNLQREDFMEDLSSVSTLKLRAGYGLTGNQDIQPYLSQTTFSPDGTVIDPETGEVVVFFTGSSNPNPDLKWEVNSEYNVGLDFGMFNDRYFLTVEYYDKTIDDLISAYDVPVPPNQFRATWANAGKIRNRGIEVTANGYVIDKERFSWESSLAFSTNQQEVLSLNGGVFNITRKEEGFISGPGLVGGENWTQVVRPGDELGTFYMPEFAGFSDGGEFFFYTSTGGVTRDVTKAERRVVGSALPKFTLGWTNKLQFLENWELSLSLRALIGHDLFNATKLIFGNTMGLMPNGNVLQYAVDEKENGLNDNATVSSYYLEDGTFLRLDNMALKYMFPDDRFQGITGFEVYISANNLFTLTNYTGLDPEISFEGLSFGIEQFNVYPRVRSFTLGVNVNLDDK